MGDHEKHTNRAWKEYLGHSSPEYDINVKIIKLRGLIATQMLPSKRVILNI